MIRPRHQHQRPLTLRSRLWLLIALSLPILLITFFIHPIAQDEKYHQFADQRLVWGIPNFYNVISNGAFLIVGGIGLWLVLSQARQSLIFIEPKERWPYLMLFVGIAMTCIGSGYYHLNPNDTHLVWDRLPITVGFMSYFSAIVAEYINVKAGLRLLVPLTILGILSIIYWYAGDVTGGHGGDLRFYYVDVQFYPLFATLFIIILFPSRYIPAHYAFGVVALYALAKLFELFDRQTFALTNEIISGHTLKHLIAAAATLYIVWFLAYRQPAPIQDTITIEK